MNVVLVKLLCVLFLSYNAFAERLQSSSRQPKFWPAGVVRFKNDVCQSVEGYDGTCYTRNQCSDSGGIPSGTCASGIGECCLFQATCGDTISNNNTYFVNPGFPNTNGSTLSCTLRIQKCTSDICQVRIDFLNFNLAQPDGNGNCVTDSFIVTGGASNVPIICGINSGEHIYVDFNGNNDIVLMISTNAALNFARSWNIKVTQIGCDCPTLAPTGCLMYYTALSGTVNSFNYGTTLSGSTVMSSVVPNNPLRPGTRELANLNYGVCVQMQPGYCSIQWSQGPDPTSFTVSGDTALAAADPPPGLPSGGINGMMCTTDFVVIPNPVPTVPVAGAAPLQDRFCGNQLPTVTTSSKPFVLTVVTNGNDMDDVANRGFSLDYQQIPCSGNSGIFVMTAQ